MPRHFPRLGIPRTATLASLYTEEGWSLPPARTEELLAIQIHITIVCLSQQPDTIEWEIQGKTMEKFSTGAYLS